MKNKANAVLALYGKEFRTSKKPLLIWTLAISAYMFLNMMVFLLMEKMLELPEMGAMPDMAMMANFNIYFALQYDSVAMILCGAGMLFGASAFHKEETSGSIEYLYATQVSRLDIYVSKVLFVTTKLIVIATSALLVSIIVGAIIAPDTMNVGAMLVSWIVSVVGILFFAAVGYLFASILPKRTSIIGPSLGFVIGTYVLGTLGTFGIKGVEFLEYFSPIHIMSSFKVMTHNWGVGIVEYPIAGFLVILIITVATTIGSYFLYKKKDLQ